MSVAQCVNPAKDSDYIAVRVYAGMKKERFTQIGPHRYEAIIKEPAINNLANRRVIALIAEIYQVNSNRVRIVSGHHSPQKVLTIIKQT